MNKTGVVNITAKVEDVIKTIYLEQIEEFYFKLSVPDGYRLKTTERTEIDSIYLTEAEVHELLNKLHIKTEIIVHKVFKMDFLKELQIRRTASYIHELGIIKATFSSVNATKEDLINAVNHLRQITKDSELASLDVEGIQQETLFNILHNKHHEYFKKYEDFLLTESNSGS